MAVIELRDVSRVVDGAVIIDSIDWVVADGDRWVVLGPNGSGKTSLLRLVGMWDQPSAGSVTVLGESFGATDVRRLRRRIGFASSSLAEMLRAELTVFDVVLTAAHAALEPWWHDYDTSQREAALAALDLTGCSHLAQRTFGSCSSGEQRRVLLARALSNAPGLVLLDEPFATLDLGGREALLATLGEFGSAGEVAPLVLVTHHIEEIPPSFTHVLLLRDGRAIASGPVGDTLDSDRLSECFGLDLVVERRGGRFSARAR